ncbi:MAG: NapC/NirT family cytochrome c [Ignavibacteriaceae bacterium]|nr:NapC/NirT family cytochrome c [Ignavibacteriaceae bacterium]
MKRFFPEEVYNPITNAGAGLSALSFGLIIFLTILDFLSPESKPYMGILTFIILPGFLLVGVAFILFGIIRERGRLKKGIIRKSKLILINLNDPKQRKFLISISLGMVLLLFFSAFGTFKAYEYTETDEFCGEVCHKVMEPEYTAYLDSPHSRVGCVKCHIGEGTGWYVKSKISGAYQVYSVLLTKYSTPIPTPVKELRPAEGTCEQCHSPSYFLSEKKTNHTYYLSDEKNTKSELSMLVKIGGGDNQLQEPNGIHWHISQDNKISYIYSDDRRLVIPWVKQITKDGKEIIYRSTEVQFDEKKFNPENLRTMDCIDCHNRPSHIYHQPDKMVNLHLAQRKMDESLPFIKSISVHALEQKYSNKPTALDSIEITVDQFYKYNYPEIYNTKLNSIKTSIGYIKKIYSRNYFPYMNADWKHFPDNISHVYTPGCFRCHDGKHVSEDGKVISKDCNSCHLIIKQTTNGGLTSSSLDGLEFEHPVDLGESVEFLMCTDCHSKN